MQLVEGFILPVLFLQTHLGFSVGYKHSSCLLCATNYPVVLLCVLLWRDHVSQAAPYLPLKVGCYLPLKAGCNAQPVHRLTAFCSSDGKSRCGIH